jgi:Tfp pilus assembly protein PilZ
VNGQSHIVALTDLGPEGAFLSTRLDVAPGQDMLLEVVIPRSGGPMALPCELVWRNERFDAASGRPAGIAVRFKRLPADVVRRIEEFSQEGFLPTPQPVPADHFEYRVVETAGLDTDELNHLGRDGWVLTVAVPTGAGCRLVLVRRL